MWKRVKYHVPDALVVSQRQTGTNIYTLTIACREIATEAKPGQFVHLRCSSGLDPLLRRPFSIYQVERKEGLVSFCYQVVGKGTKLLSRVKEGTFLDVMGPLGHGFETELCGKRVGLIGGGLGIAPLIFLGQELAKNNEVQGFWGGRSKVMMPQLAVTSDFPYFLATEDGSAGHRGLVTELVEQWLQQETPDQLYACGPRPMLAAVAQLARSKEIPLQVSLESVMACGVGACLGCICEKAGADEEKRLKVCQDGPVFWAEEVQWDGEN